MARNHTSRIKQNDVERREWRIALVLVIMTTLSTALVVGASFFVSDLEFQYSLPYRQPNPALLVDLYQTYYRFAWGIPCGALIFGVGILQQRSISQFVIVVYLATFEVVTVCWLLLTLIVFYLANQSFAFT